MAYLSRPMRINSCFGFLSCNVLLMQALAADIQILPLGRQSSYLAWTNALSNGVCTVESARVVTGPWQPERNYFTTGSIGQTSFSFFPSNRFYRLLAVDISTNTPDAFSNLVN